MLHGPPSIMQEGLDARHDFTPAALYSQREEQHWASLSQSVPFPKHAVHLLFVGEQ